MRLKTDCDVITHSIVKQTWHITTKMEAVGNIQHSPLNMALTCHGHIYNPKKYLQRLNHMQTLLCSASRRMLSAGTCSV